MMNFAFFEIMEEWKPSKSNNLKNDLWKNLQAGVDSSAGQKKSHKIPDFLYRGRKTGNKEKEW